MDRYDLLIIGGGINGTAIAAAAAACGISVLLVEKSDLGSGTSSASSKLIHGGLRYLQYGELGLVRESLHEREVLLRQRPHLVRPIDLLIPVREGGPVPPWKLEAGLSLYDRLAGASSLPRHRRLSRKETLRREPHLEAAGLRCGFVYSDGQAVFPERLCVELASEAAAAGALIRTHTAVVGLRRESGRVVGAFLQPEGRPSTGEVADVPAASSDPAACRLSTDDCEPVDARLTINAAGPWVDSVRQLLGERTTPLLRGTKGSHIVLSPPDHGPRGPLYHAARSDGRPFFILPWRELLLIGTTDIRYEGDPCAAMVEPFELQYLLEETAALFPSAQLSPERILYSYSGVRPLPRSRHPAAKITRRHQVVDHTSEGAPGLWSIVGGKLTTHRSLAKDAVRRAFVWLGRDGARCPAAPRELDLTSLRRSAEVAATGLPLDAAQVEHLVSLYGPVAGELIECVRRDPAMGERICPSNPDVAAQVVWAVEREWAHSLADLLLRRIGIGTSACLGLDCTERAAEMMARAAGWNAPRREAEIAEYRQLIEFGYRARLNRR